jgi:hypothetical protein
MKRFEVVEIEYDKLRNDLRQNCDKLIHKHNIKFNYDIERDEYVALVKMSKSPFKKKSRNTSPAKISQNFNKRMQKREETEKYGIHKKIKRRSIKANTSHVHQADFHNSCMLSFSQSRSNFKRVRSPVVYRPSHKIMKKMRKSAPFRENVKTKSRRTPSQNKRKRDFSAPKKVKMKRSVSASRVNGYSQKSIFFN